MKQDKFKESIKESLDSYSPEVPAHLWENIRAGIPAAPAASSPAAAASQSGMGIASIVKWVAAAVVVTGVTVWAWPDKAVENAPERTEQVEAQTKNVAPSTNELTTENQEASSEIIGTSESETTNEALPIASAEEVGAIAQTEVSQKAAITEEAQLNETEESGSTGHETVVNADNHKAQKSQDSKVTNVDESGNQTATKSGAKQQVTADVEYDDYPDTEIEHATEVYPMVECGILADKVTGEAPLTVFFRNISDARSYEWDFENGSKSFKKEATVTFDEPGDYVVELIVTDFEGNQITDEMEITVLETSTCFVPNAFSPNGDGLNDYFMVQGNNISDVSIEIFRLDGSLVYEGKGLNARWNGADEHNSENDQYMAVVRFVRNDGSPDVVKTVLKVIRE